MKINLGNKFENVLRLRAALQSNHLFVFIFYLIVSSISVSHAQRLMENAPELQGIDIREKLGEKIPLGLRFKDEDGNEVQLADVFNDGIPVLFTLAYYECPMLCTFVLNGLSKAIVNLDWKPLMM